MGDDRNVCQIFAISSHERRVGESFSRLADECDQNNGRSLYAGKGETFFFSLFFFFNIFHLLDAWHVGASCAVRRAYTSLFPPL